MKFKRKHKKAFKSLEQRVTALEDRLDQPKTVGEPPDSRSDAMSAGIPVHPHR